MSLSTSGARLPAAGPQTRYAGGRWRGLTQIGRQLTERGAGGDATPNTGIGRPPGCRHPAPRRRSRTARPCNRAPVPARTGDAATSRGAPSRAASAAPPRSRTGAGPRPTPPHAPGHPPHCGAGPGRANGHARWPCGKYTEGVMAHGFRFPRSRCRCDDCPWHKLVPLVVSSEFPTFEDL